MRTTLHVTGALIVLLIASPSRAQFSAPIRYNEGPGIKLTDRLVFHPGVAFEGRFDSNPLSTENADPAGYMRIIGHLDLATLSSQRLTDGSGTVRRPNVEFRAKTAVAFREYFSDNANVKAQRAVEVDAGFLLGLFPQRLVSFDLTDDFARTVQPPYQLAPVNLPRDTNRLSAKLNLTPGGGRMVFSVGYAFNFDIFEEGGPENPSLSPGLSRGFDLTQYNKFFHEINAQAKWKILPKTAVQLEVIQQFTDYINPTGKSDSMPLRIYLGLVGLITPQLSTTVKVGYGNGFYDEGESYNNVLGQAELGYQFSPFAKARIGFNHLFQDAILANYFTDELAYVGYDHLIAQRVLLHVRADYRYRNYSTLPPSYPRELKQNLVSASVGADYQIKEWIYVGIGYDLQLTDRITQFVSDSSFAPSFTKHQVFGKVGVSY